jgi:hypothetical protein
MTAEEQVIIKASELRATAGVYWDDFVTALQGYVQDRSTRVVTAPPDKLVNFQGQAQGVSHLTNILKDAHLTALKIKGKQNG